MKNSYLLISKVFMPPGFFSSSLYETLKRLSTKKVDVFPQS